MARKTSTEEKIDTLCREMKELKAEVKQLNSSMNFGKGAAWVLIFIGSIAAGVYNYFK
jgi:hypothetical protein